MARKPLDRWWKIKDDGKKIMGRVMTVAENVLKWGTGGINIDESRVWTEDKMSYSSSQKQGVTQFGTGTTEQSPLGRFPANLIHDNSEEVRECFPESNSGNGKASTYEKFGGQWGKGKQIRNEDYGDSGNASRFFKSIIYQAKASKAERNRGCEGLEDINVSSWHFKCETCGHTYAEQKEKSGCHCENPKPIPWTGTSKNNHPTVKPVALMEYLIKMVTPKGGIVLDPFAGSGSTLVAAKQNGFNYIGIEITEEYIPIIEARLNATEEDITEE